MTSKAIGLREIMPNRNVISRATYSARKIALPTLEGIVFERTQQIICLEAQGNYTNILFSTGRQLLVSKTLGELENMLNDGCRFVRVHRSSTINLDYLHKYIKGKGGYVIMENGNSVAVSNGKKQEFMEAIRIYFA
ncbi:MAG: hypothetical protein DHS20C18_04290 [Saprospiraceae bacterium]|nr:MAG: hypothetical protein DHS20C18_04290 [Saprospiraceae bacterium]